MPRKTLAIAVIVLLSVAGAAQAQAPAAQPAAPAAPAASGPPPEYGLSISTADAKKIAAAAIAEHDKMGVSPMAIAIVDTGGHLVYFEKIENTQVGSVQIAIDKARSAVLYRRSTKAFDDAVAGGGAGLRLLAIRELMPIEGGVPLMTGGKVVGAIGASGGSAQQDGQVALAGAAALK
jgi:glc operon protein GlcG